MARLLFAATILICYVKSPLGSLIHEFRDEIGIRSTATRICSFFTYGNVKREQRNSEFKQAFGPCRLLYKSLAYLTTDVYSNELIIEDNKHL